MWCPARHARRRSAVGLNTGDEDGIHSAMAAPPGAPATQPAISTESGTFSAYMEQGDTTTEHTHNTYTTETKSYIGEMVHSIILI